jgi:hypothetical protein
MPSPTMPRYLRLAKVPWHVSTGTLHGASGTLKVRVHPAAPPGPTFKFGTSSERPERGPHPVEYGSKCKVPPSSCHCCQGTLPRHLGVCPSTHSVSGLHRIAEVRIRPEPALSGPGISGRFTEKYPLKSLTVPALCPLRFKVILSNEQASSY